MPLKRVLLVIIVLHNLLPLDDFIKLWLHNLGNLGIYLLDRGSDKARFENDGFHNHQSFRILLLLF